MWPKDRMQAVWCITPQHGKGDALALSRFIPLACGTDQALNQSVPFKRIAV